MDIAYVSVPREPVGPGLTAHGSIGIVVANTARALAARHPVTIYAPHSAEWPAEERTAEGVVVRRVGRVARMLHEGLDLLGCLLPALPAHTHSGLYAVEYYAAVARALAEAQPQAVILQTFLQAAPRLRRACPNAIIAVQAHDARIAEMTPAEAGPALEVVDLILTISDYLAGGIRERHPTFRGRIVTVHNGVDLDRFVPAPTSTDSQTLLYLGRLAPEKGLHVLMEAMNRVVEGRPQARLELIGQPGLLPYSHLKLLRADPHVAALDRFYGAGLTERVRLQVLAPGKAYAASLHGMLTPAASAATIFIGRIPHDDIPLRIASSAMVVFPSVWEEPFGLPLVEAMAAGVPAIGTRSGAMPEIVVDGESGLLVERSDAGALADAIIALLADPERRQRMGQAGRERAARLFTWQQSAASLEAALRP
jgi:glycosyltransferase involved in cell wall biosynthesis